ncbi:hypothetical protein Ccrd_005300 [Cynara cardunculus var. scolymus]|uniref:Uncharacterized protein n=1 Tax=Cynara cardunculus var. scolymus TaxID=59895 RepID=A0A103XL15_CYNCS|nr:hypothetical protein Ccrd_005300 [Cynara cardunculus var. scolymus]
MGSTTRRQKNFPARRIIRRSISSHYKRSRSLHNKSTITASLRSSVSDKLQALKNLIPVQELDGAAGIGSADELFQETADYILLLRTRVSILQKLVDFYGSSQNHQIVQQ